MGLAQFGRCVRALRSAGCQTVCLAGLVRTTDFKSLRPDLEALKHLPRVMAAARSGDDALLRAILGAFEAEGFGVEGLAQAAPDLLLEHGPLGRVVPEPEQAANVTAALSGARLYWENWGKVGFFNVKGVTVPAAVSVFPDELYAAPRSWAAQAYPKLIHYNRLATGGHFAAWEQPALMAEEIRAGFKPLRHEAEQRPA